MTYNEHLQWLITLSSDPGAKHYAWARALELDADKSGLWTGIAQDLKRAMLELKAVPEAQKSGG